MYAEMHCRSAFSFLEAASIPETLAETCAEKAIPALALLDRDGVYGSPRMHFAAKQLGIKAHVGAEVTLEDSLFGAANRCRYPLIAETKQGYQNLSRLITRYKLREREKGEGAATSTELEEHAAGLICLTGGVEGPLAEALMRGGYDEGVRAVERIVHTFGPRNVYVEVQRHRNREQEARNKAAVSIAQMFRLPLLATNGVTYATPIEREIQDVMTAIRMHTTLEGAGLALDGNAERHLRTQAEMEKLFADLPEAVHNSGDLSFRLSFELDALGYEFPRYPVGAGETMNSFLRERALEGLSRRYAIQSRDIQQRARAQVEKELAMIEKLELAGYFLIVWDLIEFCAREKILVQGRGSAANSVVCYSLGITAVDPIRLNLLFERFLSEERGEWPDIDLDLPSGNQRERVIQHLYRKYGSEGAAIVANVITYREKSAAKEVGKILGLDSETLARVSSEVGSFEWKAPSDSLHSYIKRAGLGTANFKIAKFLNLIERMQDLPRNLGQHSGGMVVCQHLLSSVVPIEPATMPGRVVLQWDKDDCADLGIVKIDLLGLGMMAVLEECLALIVEHYGIKIDLGQLPADDPAVYAAICRGDVIGDFQIESRAQLSALLRTKPKCFFDLVVQVALIRPGPIVGEMVNPYIQRRLGRQPIRYPHPDLEPVLKETLGVPLFQEQVLQIAMIMGGLTGGQAEQLRRAMGSKRAEKKIHAMEALLREGMNRKGVDEAAQKEVLGMIASSAKFQFPKSHAASFALLAYASAYLRHYYRPAFTVALLNNQPMGFYSPDTIVRDGQRHGLKVRAIDVNQSDWLCTVQTSEGTPPERAVRMGLRYVRGLRESSGQALVRERERAPFSSVQDLVRRVPELHRDEVKALAQVGALNWLYELPEQRHRRAAMWDAERALRPAGPLFESLEQGEPELPLARMTDEERIVADYEGTGITIGPQLLHYHRHDLDRLGISRASDLETMRDGCWVRLAGVVIVRQMPGTAKGFTFMTFEDETGISNAIFTPDFYESHHAEIMRGRVLLVEGKLQNMDDAISVKVSLLRELQLSEMKVPSHDFH
jgi:error-prone DNA polymerase